MNDQKSYKRSMAYLQVAEKEIQIRREVPNWHLKLVTAVIFTFREFQRT